MHFEKLARVQLYSISLSQLCMQSSLIWTVDLHRCLDGHLYKTAFEWLVYYIDKFWATVLVNFVIWIYSKHR